jgi:outer membrane protein assembly factor BamB
VRLSILHVLVAALALLVPAGRTPASAQTPPAGSGARMSPPESGQPPTPGQPGRGGPPGPQRPGANDKNKKPEKFGPTLILPMQVLYYNPLGAAPVVAPAHDDEQFYVAFKNWSIASWHVWDFTLAWGLQNVQAANHPLVLDSGRLYATLEGNELIAIDAASSKILWRLPAGGPVSTPPIAKAGWLIVALETTDEKNKHTTGELRALRGETGEVVWHISLADPLKTKPIIIGDRLYIAPENKHLVALDLVSGQQLWVEELDEQISSIAASEQRVFAGTRNKFFAFDHAGHLKWTRRLGAEVIGDAVTDAEGVYGAFTDNTLLALGNNGDLRWRTGLAYRPMSGPVMANGTMLLLVGSAPVLHGYDMKDGKASPDFNPPADTRALMFSPPMFARGRTFFQDTVLVVFAHGAVAAGIRTGPGVIFPFRDPGVKCPPLSLPAEQPPPTAAATPATPPRL